MKVTGAAKSYLPQPLQHTLKLDTIRCRQPIKPQKFLESPGRRSPHGRYVTEQPATTIAESLMTNPWTAALVSDSTDRPELYNKGSALTRAGLSTWETANSGNNILAAVSVAQPRCTAQDNLGSCHAVFTPAEQGAGCQSPRQAEQQFHTMTNESPALHDCGDSIDSAQQCCSSAASSTAEEVCASSHHRADAGRSARNSVAPDDGTTYASPRQGNSMPASPGSACEDHMIQQWVDGIGQRAGAMDRLAAPLTRESSPSQTIPTVIAPAAAVVNDGPPHQHSVMHESVAGQQQTQQQQSRQPKHDHKPRYTSWTGDYGHLNSPRFTRDRSTAWQADLRNRRDCPDKHVDMCNPDTRLVEVSCCLQTLALYSGYVFGCRVRAVCLSWSLSTKFNDRCDASAILWPGCAHMHLSPANSAALLS